MKNLTKIVSLLMATVSVLNLAFTAAYANTTENGFELVTAQELTDLGGTAYYYKHNKTGAEVVYLDNGAQRLEFSIGFKTPPADSKGANHVLEHSLLCGSDKYPTKNIMHYIGQGTSSLITMGVTVDDCTYYPVKTSNLTEYYNVIDVYMNGIFHPLLLKDKNIFYQQGIRLEYADGKARYNGVVYNELRMKRLDTQQNSLTFLSNKLYEALYGNTSPAFNSGGSIDELKNLTYEDLLHVYNTYYIPSNSMTYIAGKQDIHKTLNMLDSFFMGFEKQETEISFTDTKQLPSEPVSEYNITEDTRTVDIGFMSSGVPVYRDEKEVYARDIIFNIIKKQMDEKNSKNYVLGGSSGGISTIALLVSEIPVEQKEEMITSYNSILNQLETNGFETAVLNEEIENYFADKKNPYTNSTDLKIFNSILYHNDPFANIDMTSAETALKEDKEYFNTVLQNYFTQNPYNKTVISGNSTTPVPDDTLNVSADELERIKHETEKFQKWADTPDDPSVIEQLPLLSLDEVKDAPETITPKQEELDGISFYYTEKSNQNYAGLFFPLAAETEELNYVQLMYAFMSSQAEKSGLSDTYFGLLPMENYNDSKKINPQFFMEINTENAPAALQAAMEFLQDETVWNIQDLKEYIKTAPVNILKNSYQDPYYLSYEMMQSAQSWGKRFSSSTTGSIQQGSTAYYRFLKELDPDNASMLLEKIKSLIHSVILDNKPTAEYVGNEGYMSFKNAVIAQFKNAPQKQSTALPNLAGCDSAATITALEDANHFMLAGSFDNKDYSGKLAVLGGVLSANYLTPILRGKYGAYGAKISFSENNMVSSATGLEDIDLTLKVWQGMGDYLRSLNMTQNELDAIIVSAVEQYDKYDYTSSEYGAQSALTEKSTEDLIETRNEMLSTTVEDLRGYADFIDRLVAQNRVFAVLGKNAADNAVFPFTYYADADTLEITSQWKKKPGAYLNGKTNTLFAPDALITRGEIAALISRLSADERGPEFENRFRDLSSNDWYYDAVRSVSEKNIMAGYDNGLFMPEKNITRAELSTVLSQFIFKGKTRLEAPYSDISPSDWYYTSIAKLVNAGFIKGYQDGTLRPDAPVTRAEVVTVLNRMLGISYSNNINNPFADVNQDHWAYNHIIAAAK
jgi:Zn-dependent M16 (insulinase) family peptidase